MVCLQLFWWQSTLHGLQSISGALEIICYLNQFCSCQSMITGSIKQFALLAIPHTLVSQLTFRLAPKSNVRANPFKQAMSSVIDYHLLTSVSKSIFFHQRILLGCINVSQNFNKSTKEFPFTFPRATKSFNRGKDFGPTMDKSSI